MAGGQLAPRHVLGQYEWSAAFPVSTKAHLSAVISGARSLPSIPLRECLKLHNFTK
jgi:hypothetical protein